MARRVIQKNGEVATDRGTVSYTLYRMVGRKHVHLLVGDNDQLEVRAPWRFSGEEAEEAIGEHLEWVLRSLERARRRRRARPILRSGTRLPLFDESLVLRLQVAAQLSLLPECRRPEVRRAAGDDVRSSDGRAYRRGSVLNVETCVLGTEAVPRLLEGWYREQAKQVLPGRIHELGGELGVAPSRITIRSQRSRWGSCSSEGSINLNWRLLLLPSDLADYVLVHELCHLRHMDHSARFWDMVGSVMPDYSVRRRRLDAAQARLFL